ncbi:MAG TPA: 2-phospho-L-lactate guanylyltransferase [Nitrososphaerales archaeon]|nr:2-phospho-L-lactate guanylyltransferase [Nitrososphaerales archaeon]
MKSLVILIPVKSRGAKSRLSKQLTYSQRRQVTLLMLKDLLDVVKSSDLTKACYVVSPDDEVLSIAERSGAGIIREETDRGVNAAVARGMRDTESEDLMVIPSDLPFLVSSDLRRLRSLKSSGLKVVMSPSMGFDGTNALLFSRKTPIPLSYDNNSFWTHLESAGSASLSVGIYSGPGVMFDVDTPEDFIALGRSKVKRRSVSFAKEVL